MTGAALIKLRGGGLPEKSVAADTAGCGRPGGEVVVCGAFCAADGPIQLHLISVARSRRLGLGACWRRDVSLAAVRWLCDLQRATNEIVL